MTSPVDICNWALLRLGEPRINSIDPPFTDADGIASYCAFIYPLVRDSELRANVWSFARARAVIAASGDTPLFGTGDDAGPSTGGPSWADCSVSAPAINQYQVPNDFIRMIKMKYEQRRLEGQYILTYEGSPLYLNYVRRAPEYLFDPMFVEALSCKIALQLTEKITTSSQKKSDIEQDYAKAISEAKRINAIEAPAERTPEDSFITVRR